MTHASASEVELEIAAFHQPAIDSARKLIFWAGLVYPVQQLMLFATLSHLVGPSVFATRAFALMFGIACGLWGIHVALARWAKRAPLPATTVALGVYLSYLGVLVHHDALGTPIIPIIILFFLGRAVRASYRVHQLRTRRA